MKVLLRNKEQWERFKEHQTEMLITKGGRYVSRSNTLMLLQGQYTLLLETTVIHDSNGIRTKFLTHAYWVAKREFIVPGYS